jgi:hypothetical protein
VDKIYGRFRRFFTEIYTGGAGRWAACDKAFIKYRKQAWGIALSMPVNPRYKRVRRCHAHGDDEMAKGDTQITVLLANMALGA